MTLTELRREGGAAVRDAIERALAEHATASDAARALGTTRARCGGRQGALAWRWPELPAGDGGGSVSGSAEPGCGRPMRGRRAGVRDASPPSPRAPHLSQPPASPIARHRPPPAPRGAAAAPIWRPQPSAPPPWQRDAHRPPGASTNRHGPWRTPPRSRHGLDPRAATVVDRDGPPAPRLMEIGGNPQRRGAGGRGRTASTRATRAIRDASAAVTAPPATRTGGRWRRSPRPPASSGRSRSSLLPPLGPQDRRRVPVPPARRGDGGHRRPGRPL